MGCIVRTLLACVVSCSVFGMNTDVLETIERRFHESETDALRIEQDGKEILALGSEAPFETMSITKSMVNLAIGILVDRGDIPSLHTPIATYYPEWNVDEKRHVTIYHILSHTTGLECFSSFEEGYLSPDYIRSALDADFIHAVGSDFMYNNRIINLLGGIVEKISGKRLDLFVEETIFEPLDITDYYWNLDFSGNTMCMCGLEISANELAKIGRLILNRGRWGDKQIVSEEWLKRSFEPSQPYNAICGLLWWLDREQFGHWPEQLLSQYERAGVSPEYLEVLYSLEGKKVRIDDMSLRCLFGSDEAYRGFAQEIKDKGLEFCEVDIGPIKGYRADGYLGQYLLIIPKYNVVAVRQIEYGKKPDDQMDPFEDFIDLVHALFE